MFGRRRTEVLVIGGGPVGLLTALRLSSQGAKVQVVDQHRRTGVHSYALALHPRSLRLLGELGLADELIAAGYRVDRVTFLDGQRERFSLSLAELSGAYPFVLVLPQRVLESVLEQRLARQRVRVQWNHRVQRIDARETEQRTEIARLDQVPAGYPIARLEWVVDRVLEMRSAFVVGADGYHSFVRGQLGLGFPRLGAERVFAVYELDSPVPLAGEVRIAIDSAALATVLWPMPRGRCRFSFELREPEQHAPTIDGLNALVRERAPWFPETSGELHWSALVHFDQRLAERFGRDRVWLAGDAAHITSPLGVQSLNGGLVEAWELGGLLAGHLRGDCALTLLEDYGAERVREWRSLLALDGALSATGADEWIRQHATTILGAVPATGEDLVRLLGQCGVTYSPTPGGLALQS